VGLFTNAFAERIRYHSIKGSPAGPLVGSFAECICRHSANVASLSSAKATTLDKKKFTGAQVCLIYRVLLP
jgi:hypothetical protein